jgi:hypothetical protein
MNRIIDRRGRWLLMLRRLHPVVGSSTIIARRVHSIQIMRMMMVVVVVVKLALSSVGVGVVVGSSSGSIDWWWRSNHRRPHYHIYRA